MQTTDLNTYIQHFSYFGIFLWFLVIEQLMPIPEEVSLISLGYLCIHNHLNPFIAGGFSLAGLLITDNILFYLSFKGNRYTERWTKNFNSKLLLKLKSNLQTHSTRTLIFCALLPKIRFLSPIIAATSEVRWKHYFVVNSLTTLAYVTIYAGSGIVFHQSLTRIFSQMQAVQHIVFLGIITIIFVVLMIRLRKYLAKINSSSD